MPFVHAAISTCTPRPASRADEFFLDEVKPNLTLQVRKGNPAEHLYRLLDFRVTRETELRRHMTWQGGPR